MRCDLDPEELHAFIDGELDPRSDRAVRSHVAGCGDCRAELGRLRAVDDAIRDGGASRPSEPMRARVLAAASTAAASRPRWRVAAAAVLVAAAFVTGAVLTRGDDPTAEDGSVDLGAIEALELDAASLRLELLAEDPAPHVSRPLSARLDAIEDRIARLRAARARRN